MHSAHGAFDPDHTFEVIAHATRLADELQDFEGVVDLSDQALALLTDEGWATSPHLASLRHVNQRRCLWLRSRALEGLGRWEEAIQSAAAAVSITRQVGTVAELMTATRELARKRSAHPSEVGWYLAIDPTVASGGFYPNALSDFLGYDAPDHVGLQFALDLPRHATLRSVTRLLVAVQNPWECQLEYEVRLDGDTRRLGLAHGVKHRLGPGESGLLAIPLWVRENAQPSERDINVRFERVRRSQRSPKLIYPIGAKPPLPRQDVLARNLIGLGLLATAGVGFVSFPRGEQSTFYKMTLNITPSVAHGYRPTDINPSYAQIWRVPGSPEYAVKFAPVTPQ